MCNKMKIRYNIFRIFFMLLSALLMTACSSDITTDDEQPLPEGMGRIRITISTPENAQTRAVNAIPWEDPDHEWERLQTFRILICGTDNKVVQVISGTKEDLTEETHTGSENEGTPNSTKSTHKWATLTSGPLAAGSYFIYAVANFTDEEYAAKYDVGKTIAPDATINLTNGYSENLIPMTGKLSSAVTVTTGTETDAGTISVWRVMAKMQFYFTNESASKIRIKGIEVEPINQASSGPGIYLFSKDDLESINNLSPQTISSNGREAGVTATWALHDATLQTNASVSESGVFEQAQLSYGAKLESTGQVVAGDAAHSKLQKFNYIGTEKMINREEAAVINLTVKPRSGLSFTPKKLSFTASRIGTDGGNFDVVTVSGSTSTNVATGVRPERYNVSPFISRYEYDLSGSATTGEFKVNIYIYNLDPNKQYAFSDIVITGKVTDTEDATVVEKITLPDGARADVGTVRYEPSTALELNATNGKGTLFFYVNETDATYTAVNNQLSLRFKIQRQNPTTQEWYDDEIRYGVTTHHDLTSNGIYGGQDGGFNVIRRNDWVHIPIVLTDWQFRVEPLAFVPIAGYPATLLSSDGLTATFSTGGMIALQPFIKKYTDSNWRDFGNSEVTLVDITWKNSDGTIVSGDNKIVKTDFAYDPVTKCIIGELNQAKVGSNAKTTFTVNVDLGKSPDPVYHYSFTFNVILK